MKKEYIEKICLETFNNISKEVFDKIIPKYEQEIKTKSNEQGQIYTNVANELSFSLIVEAMSTICYQYNQSVLVKLFSEDSNEEEL